VRDGFHSGNNEVSFDATYRVYGMIGPHHTPDDGLRHWIHWIRANDNYRVLYTPLSAIRRQAEWDDHGEAYSMNHEGPDLWAVIRTPPGQHVASFYFYNKDGHSGHNRFRDYIIEIRYQKDPPNSESSSLSPEAIVEARRLNLLSAMKEPLLAGARVKDFWGGVYKSFLLNGAGTFYVRIARNGSLNTILSGVFLDKANEPDDISDRKAFIDLNYCGLAYGPPGCLSTEPIANVNLGRVFELWRKTPLVLSRRRGAFYYAPSQCLAYRAALGLGASQNATDYMLWYLKACPIQERHRFWDMMMEAWSRRQDRCVALRSNRFRPNSPNVVDLPVEKLIEMDNTGTDWKTLLHH
jgi:hypothetical protein